MTTPQTGLSMSSSQAYREKMFNLLANRDPLDVLAQSASTLAGIVGKHSATVLRTRPFEGKWTPIEIIGHLTDSEWVYGYRLRLILSENDPAILGTNQDMWVAALRHNERGPESLDVMLRLLAGHDLSHLDQITRYIQAVHQRE
jgi:hypothetical protein